GYYRIREKRPLNLAQSRNRNLGERNSFCLSQACRPLTALTRIFDISLTRARHPVPTSKGWGMARLSYDSVEALIYDPVSANRTATRAALYSLGFRRTETVSTLEATVEVIQRQPPDIVLAEAQGAADELCLAIQQLRQEIGRASCR